MIPGTFQAFWRCCVHGNRMRKARNDKRTGGIRECALTDSMAQIAKREKPLKASLGIRVGVAPRSAGWVVGEAWWLGRPWRGLSRSVTEERFSTPSGRPTSWKGRGRCEGGGGSGKGWICEGFGHWREL
ncbi:putative epidermal growth factor receptor isoform X1 [Sesbania bispinosa]|nr:putative epidermal growth factor receptor isoform X1 [Sesbania bispinosa]